jgi:hypothetical protein
MLLGHDSALSVNFFLFQFFLSNGFNYFNVGMLEVIYEVSTTATAELIMVVDRNRSNPL